MLDISERAATRVENQGAAHYVFNSIIAPDEFVVESFEAGLMPQNWAEIYSVQEIADIMAYLFTLEGASADAQVATDDSGNGEIATISALPETADASNGETLFNTFPGRSQLLLCELPPSRFRRSFDRAGLTQY